MTSFDSKYTASAGKLAHCEASKPRDGYSYFMFVRAPGFRRFGVHRNGFTRDVTKLFLGFRVRLEFGRVLLVLSGVFELETSTS